jgi:hypothetical protein
MCKFHCSSIIILITDFRRGRLNFCGIKLDMARKHRTNRRRKNRQSGGGPGAAYSVEGVLVPGLPYLINNPISNCQATAPDYAVKGVPSTGLPGLSGPGPLPGLMSGGSRRGRGRRSRKQSGGRYEITPAPVGGMDSPNVAAITTRVACEAGASPHVSPTVPTLPQYDSLPGAAPSALRGMPEPATISSSGFQSGGSARRRSCRRNRRSNRRAASRRNRRRNRRMRGGALQPPYSGSPVLEETTAGYTHLRSGSDAVVTQAGVPVMFNIPSGGRVGVPDACIKTH